jgi:hypothetical protein
MDFTRFPIEKVRGGSGKIPEISEDIAFQKKNSRKASPLGR